MCLLKVSLFFNQHINSLAFDILKKQWRTRKTYLLKEDRSWIQDRNNNNQKTLFVTCILLASAFSSFVSETCLFGGYIYPCSLLLVLLTSSCSFFSSLFWKKFSTLKASGNPKKQILFGSNHWKKKKKGTCFLWVVSQSAERLLGPGKATAIVEVVNWVSIQIS